jgi:hypothetical protein
LSQFSPAVNFSARRETPILLLAGGASACLALAVGTQPIAAGAATGALAFSLLVLAFRARPHWIAPAVVAGFVVQPALKTFVSPYFGPAKDVVVAAAIVGVLSAQLGSRPRKRPGSEADAWITGGVVVLLGLYLTNPGGTHGPAWGQGTRLVFEAFALFLIGYTTEHPARAWRWACASLISVAVLNACLGTVQQAIGTTSLIVDYGYTWGLQVRETATGQFRSFGTFDDPFNYAAFLLVALTIAAFTTRRKLIAVPVSAVLLLGAAESFVRTSIFIIPVLIAVLLLRGRRGTGAIAIVAGVVIAAGGWLLLTPQGAGESASGLSFITTLNGRTETWSKVIRGPVDLIGGRGAGAIGSGATRAQFGTILPTTPIDDATPTTGAAPDVSNIDSSYFATVADVGLAGLGILVAIGLRAMHLAGRAAKAGSSTAWVAIAIGCVVALDATTRSSLTAFPFGFVALYVLGLALAQARAELSELTLAERTSGQRHPRSALARHGRG